MNGLDLYHRLPPPLRSVVASGRGVQLAAWRYGPGFDDLVAEVGERDRWSEAQWERWVADRLDRVLHRAATTVPYYRRYWSEVQRTGGRRDVGELANWPLLDKQTLRADPTAFLADDVDRRRMYPEHTSGTTGTPLSLWWSRETSRVWFAMFEARVRGWAGVDRHTRWANLAGQLVVPYDATEPPYWVHNRALRQLYLSAHHLSPATVVDYAAAIERFGPRSIVGYPSAIATLAQLMTGAGIQPPESLSVAISTAEPVLSWQRTAISGGLGATVRETYGQAETVAAASECAHGSRHWWPDVGIIERAGSAEASAGGGARGATPMVVTGLLNADMPLIRYELGDTLLPSAGGEPNRCRCGRALPQWGSVEGRVDDLVVGAGGRTIGRLDTVFKADLPLQGAQIIQESDDSIEVLVIAGAGYTADHTSRIIERVQERVGDLPVQVRQVESLTVDASGKFRAVKRKPHLGSDPE